ncbi:hypothetical protein IE53DRAFT_212229 [Violaceomyces palustris]|uniref:Uncharacterized protein n=1 Tax=Violaceomyces palustris TaxID=1673888 RepID=A0ACD0NQN9_9BASI|nr:hypothetical protein IE53DRAFT_212229 [Violaceomyces palustris]
MAAFTSLIPYLVVYGGPSAPSILAAAGFCRSALATAFPLFTRQMCERLTVQGAVSLLAGLALLLTPLPFLFYVFGGRLREQQTERKREAASAFTAAEVSQSPEKNPKANNSTSSSNPTDGPGVTLLFHEPDSLTASTIHSSTPVGIVT